MRNHARKTNEERNDMSKNNTLTLKDLKGLKDKPKAPGKVKLEDYVDVMPTTPDGKATTLALVATILNGDGQKYAELARTAEGRLAAAHLNNATANKAFDLGQSIDSTKRASTPPPKAPSTILTPTALGYLTRALEKNAEPLHPNFRRSIRNEEQLQFQLHLRAVCGRIIDTLGLSNPRLVAVEIGKALKTDARAYIQFFKNLATDAAFAAHMDCLSFTRNIDPDSVDHSLNTMITDDEADTHTITDDVPMYDRSMLERDAAREDYAGGDDSMRVAPIADDEFDAIDGIERLQAWLGLSITSMKPEQREYWGVDGLFPLGQRKSETRFGTSYTPIHDFADYREWATAQYKAKRRTAPIDDTTEKLMMAS